MNRILPIRIVLSILLLLPCGVCLAGAETELIRQGDVYDQKLQPTEALKYYVRAEALTPDNVDLLLRIARQYRHHMQDATNVTEKLRLGGIAKGYAERAVVLAPKNPEAHLSVAISYAKMVRLLPSKERVQSSRKIKASVEKALALDPKQDLAWHILGAWHQRIVALGSTKRALAKVLYGDLPLASNEESVKCFKKAIELNPGRAIHHIELGQTYAQMGKTAEAKASIQKGLALPDAGKDDPEIKQRGRETLGSLK